MVKPFSHGAVSSNNPRGTSSSTTSHISKNKISFTSRPMLVAASFLLMGLWQVQAAGAYPAEEGRSSLQQVFGPEDGLEAMHEAQLLSHLRETRASPSGYLFRARKSVGDSSDLNEEEAPLVATAAGSEAADPDDASYDANDGVDLSMAYMAPRVARSGGGSSSYLFRARRDPASGGQIRNRKGGYLFRTRKASGFYSNIKRAPGGYLFRTRKSSRGMSGFNSKRQGGYLFRTKKSSGGGGDDDYLDLPALENLAWQHASTAAMPQRNRRDMYLFRT